MASTRTDTRDWRRYLPLQVGNVWEYDVTEPPSTLRREIMDELSYQGRPLDGAVDVFPNPATSTVDVAFYLQAAGNATLSIVSMTGREVAEVKLGFYSSGQHHFSSDISSLAAGVYILQLETDGGPTSASLFAVVRRKARRTSVSGKVDDSKRELIHSDTARAAYRSDRVGDLFQTRRSAMKPRERPTVA